MSKWCSCVRVKRPFTWQVEFFATSLRLGLAFHNDIRVLRWFMAAGQKWLAKRGLATMEAPRAPDVFISRAFSHESRSTSGLSFPLNAMPRTWDEGEVNCMVYNMAKLSLPKAGCLTCLKPRLSLQGLYPAGPPHGLEPSRGPIYGPGLNV